jgi:hypothetical protein
MYIDKQFYAPLWEDLYDNSLKLWKTVHLAPQAMMVPRVGVVNNGGSFTEQFWDLLNAHATYDSTYDDKGHTILITDQVPKAYDDKSKYSSPGGLSTINR